MENCLDERQKADLHDYKFFWHFGEVLLEDGNIICGVQQTLNENKMATPLGLTQTITEITPFSYIWVK